MFRRIPKFLLTGLFFFLPFGAIPSAAQSSSRIAAPVDNSARVIIGHSTHPLALPRYDAGRVDPGASLQRMLLVLGASDDQERGVRTLLDAQQTKGTPEYHHWLTPEQFNARFSPAAGDVQIVADWLQRQGFSVDSIAHSGRWIQFSGTSAQVESAFQTQMRFYNVAGKTHISNASDISIPAALAPLVRGIVSLHDFFSQPRLTPYYKVQRNSDGQLVPVSPVFTIPSEGINFHFLAPGDYAKIYNLNPLYQSGASGAGQTIAIVARSKIIVQDVEIFRQIFGLPAHDPNMIFNGADPGVTGDIVEASLDAEWAAAVAPAANVDLVVSGSTATTDGVDLSSAYIVDNNLADIMSVSFGECEKTLGAAENLFFNALWQQAAAQGISVVVSSGDNGAAGCDDPNDFNDVPAAGGLAVNGIASTPYNTAVGGTEFNENGNDSVFWGVTNSTNLGSVNGYIPEMVWNESCDPTIANSASICVNGFFNLFAGSGGSSGIYAKPSWQATSLTGVPNDGKRDLPDVSLAAAAGHDGFLFCVFGGCLTTTDSNGNTTLFNANVVGGTSASAPSFAGIMAIVDQQAGGRQGLANYVLYPLAAAESGSPGFPACNSANRTNPATASACVFNDVTTGNNNVPGQTGFLGTAGFDLATGLGSVNAANLVSAWTNLVAGFKGTTIALSSNGSTTAQHGQPISFTVAVSPMSGTAVPTGNFSLITNVTGADGTGSVLTIGAGALNNGAFTGSFSDLPGGQYNVIAHYPGDSSFGASNSAPIPVNISKENSATTLSSFTINPRTGALQSGTVGSYGDTIELHSKVTGASGQGFASGTVTFNDGNSQLAALPLNSEGHADLISAGFGGQITLAVGTHIIGGSYSGDNSFNSSTVAQPLSITVNKAAPFMFVFPNLDTVNSGQSLIFLTQVFNSGPVFPTGTIQYMDGSTNLGAPVPLVSPGPGDPMQAVFQTTTLSPGTHLINAQYSGDGTYSSASSQVSVQVNPPFQLTASITAKTIQAGSNAVYSVTLSGNNSFVGQVSLSCSGAPASSTCNVSPNPVTITATINSSALTVTVSNTSNARNGPAPFHSLPVVFAALTCAMCFALRRNPRRAFLTIVLSAILFSGISACGGGSVAPSPPNTAPPTNATITVTATSGSFSTSINLSLTITH